MLDGARPSSVDEVEAVVAVVVAAATAEDVVAARRVTAEAVTAAAALEDVVVIVRVGIEDGVVGAAGDEQAGRVVVVDIEPFEDVVAALDAHAPRILAAHELMHAHHLEPEEVDEAAVHVQTGDSVRRRQVFEIEDRTFARECESS